MIRNLKALGLALVAVFAMGALSASSASAVTDVITTEGGTPALLTGVATHTPAGSGTAETFNITGANKRFQCTTAKFAATVINGNGATTDITVDAEYSGKLDATPHGTPCNSTLGDVTVDMNGCDYNLSGNTNGTDPKEAGSVHGKVWITCGAKPIEITGLGATISVPAQTPTAGGVAYSNVANHSGGKGAITVKSTITGITYTCAPAFFCGIAGIPTHGDDTDFNGHVIVTGFADNNAAGVITPANEGALKTVSIS
jgi:hypothetical protein